MPSVKFYTYQCLEESTTFTRPLFSLWIRGLFYVYCIIIAHTHTQTGRELGKTRSSPGFGISVYAFRKNCHHLCSIRILLKVHITSSYFVFVLTNWKNRIFYQEYPKLEIHLPLSLHTTCLRAHFTDVCVYMCMLCDPSFTNVFSWRLGIILIMPSDERPTNASTRDAPHFINSIKIVITLAFAPCVDCIQGVFCECVTLREGIWVYIC